jgi:hypothetical protein
MMTEEEAFKEIEKISTQTSDTYIRHYETEVKFLQEKAKLTLWIIGLSIAMELFLINKIKPENLDGISSKIFFGVISSLFIINCLYGLLTRLKQTRLMNHLLSIATSYDYQKTEIILNLKNTSELGKLLLKDFGEGIGTNKLKDLEYKNQKELKNDPIIESDRNFLFKSDNHPTTILVIQAILTISFYIFYILK